MRYLPCAVRHVTNTVILEETSNLIPSMGCRLLRTDGVQGVIAAIYGDKAEIRWNNKKLGVYSVQYGAII